MNRAAPRSRLTVLITGGAGGIGQAAARQLAGVGHAVYAADVVYDQQQTTEHGITSMPLDVTNRDSIAALVNRITDETDGAGPDVLINCAGYSTPGPIELIPLSEWQRLFEVNLFGLVAVTQACVPSMRSRTSQQPARIINIGSLIGRLPHPLSAPYCASKHALVAVNEALRCELAQFGIPVILIEPGPIRTPFFAQMQDNLDRVRATTRHEPGSESYTESLKQAQAVFEYYGNRAPGPDVVADCIARAIQAKRPRAHYTVPRHNTLRRMGYRVMPTWLTDRMMRRLFHLDR
ncbi:MAG: SDR family NAD(P)-dependent oxidoreductase [Planctomycetes bacterium]|nr:SDR family NAD(P)-dependent oxidoreductase [Planctomycetota bacterium]NOG54804.1 SDR family NAD(P)-dependent oxidoreductase [Planctomycetota bacterium]